MTIKAYNIIYNLSLAVLSQNSIKAADNAFYHLVMLSLGFLAQSIKNPPAMQGTDCNAGDLAGSLDPEDPGSRIPWR